MKFLVTEKADSKFVVVSAASVCAKVERDEMVQNWKFSEDIPLADMNWGSGYPSDPQTKAWLKRNTDPVFGFPDVVRFSWSTCDKILQAECPHFEFERDDDREEG